MAESPTQRVCTRCRASLPPRNPRAGGLPRATLCAKCSNQRGRERAAEKYAAELAEKGAVLRTCVNCRNTIAARSGTWPMSRGAPLGGWCLSCFGVRQDKFDAATRARKAKSPARQMRRLTLAQRSIEPMLGPDADRAVRLGVATVNASAPKVAKEFAAAIEDPAHEFHLEALELALQRILPMAAFNAEASQLANGGARETAQDGRPMFTVNVRRTTGTSE